MSDPETDMLRHFAGYPFLHKKPRKLGVAVSGGGDSMALLDLMLWHGAERGFPVVAVTLDHGLRAEAADEIARVAAFCSERDIKHHVLRWDWDGQGNLQAQARGVRYAMIAAWAKGAGVDLMALGHTKDDVAETFLMRIARQAGVEGLAHMKRQFSRDGMRWCRPLTNSSRAELRAYLIRKGIAWSEDPSNDDPNFTRVKARQALAALEPLGIDAHVLTGVAHNLYVANAALEDYARREAEAHVQVVAGDVILPAELASPDHHIPQEVMFRLRRAALQFVAGGEYPPRAEAVLDLDHAMWDASSRTLHGCLVTKVEGKRRNEDMWRISREHNAVKDVVCASDQIWDGRWQLEGPHAEGLEIRALGEAVKDTDWRETGLPRASLLASPAVWRGHALIAAPLAGWANGWTAQLVPGRDDFAAWLIRR